MEIRKLNASFQPFFAFAFFNDFRYAEEDEEYNQCKKSMLARSRTPNVDQQQNEIYTDSHVVD